MKEGIIFQQLQKSRLGTLGENDYFSHATRRAKRRLSWAMLRNSPLPASTLATRFARIFLCQPGEASLPARIDRQRSSMVRIRYGRTPMMGSVIKRTREQAPSD